MEFNHLAKGAASIAGPRSETAELSLRLRLPITERELLLSGHRQLLLNAFALLHEHRFGLRDGEQQSILTQVFEGRAVPPWHSRAREVELLRRILLVTHTVDTRRKIESEIGFSGVELLQDKVQELHSAAEGSWADELAIGCRALTTMNEGRRELLVQSLDGKGRAILKKLPEIAALIACSRDPALPELDRASLCTAAADFVLERIPARAFHEACREKCAGSTAVSRALLWLLLKSCDELPALTLDTLCEKASVLPLVPTETSQPLVPGPIVHPCVTVGLHRRTEALLASEGARLQVPPQVITAGVASLMSRLFGTPVELIAEPARHGSPYVWRLFHPPASECVESFC